MTLKLPIYLDHSATTPVDPRAFEAMRPFFTEIFGNAASSHMFGQAVQGAVVRARNQVAALLGVEQDERTGAREIIFTGGATESNNLALKGAADAYAAKGRHFITQVTEHKSVIDTCKRLKEQGCEITWLPVDRAGRVAPEQVAEAIRPDTVLVSIMWANNETGTIQPMRQIGKVCREQGVLFHSDATQAVGKLPIDVHADCVDLLSLTAHKLYGPKGTGALFIRRKDPRVRLTPLLDGGGHERGFRSGTLNVPGIVGLGAACAIARIEMLEESTRLAVLRDRLYRGIAACAEVIANGDIEHRLPHVLNVSFVGLPPGWVLKALDDVAVSSGSACSSASLEASYVLRAMGVVTELAHNSVRFSVGRWTSDAEIDYVIQKVDEVIRRLRAKAPHHAEAGV